MNAHPRLRIAHLPTPVETLPRLTEALGGPALLVKRDDQTGLAFGGNKTRKLELLAAEALAEGAKTLISGGAVQSNHCRQTAAAAARLGLDCTLVLTGQPPESRSGNLLLDTLLGAKIIWAWDQPRDKVMATVFQEARESGRKPYLVPYGGSSPTGALAYALAVEELIQQDCRPDWIVFASSSGGTQAGLVAGARHFGYEGQVLGISVDVPAEVLKAHVAGLATQVANLLGDTTPFQPATLQVNDDYLGAGYAVMGAPEREAILLFARLEGLLLDPVYTGRAAAGMLDLVRRGFFKPEETLLFWHTGGTPALFADPYRSLVELAPGSEAARPRPRCGQAGDPSG